MVSETEIGAPLSSLEWVVVGDGSDVPTKWNPRHPVAGQSSNPACLMTLLSRLCRPLPRGSIQLVRVAPDDPAVLVLPLFGLCRDRHVASKGCDSDPCEKCYCCEEKSIPCVHKRWRAGCIVCSTGSNSFTAPSLVLLFAPRRPTHLPGYEHVGYRNGSLLQTQASFSEGTQAPPP